MHRPIRSFVLRAGRATPRQKKGLSTWLPDYQIVSPKPWRFDEIFQREANTIVEIGFGMGDALLEIAEKNPDINYIGIEVYPPGIGQLAANLHDHGLTNVKIVDEDALDVFEQAIPDNSLAGIQVFFPDPWPKKRHHKRRLIQSENIQLLTQKLIQGGFIHCATDWADYAEQMLQVCDENPHLINQATAGGFCPRPITRPLTKFERRGERLGHGVWDVIFQKK